MSKNIFKLKGLHGMLVRTFLEIKIDMIREAMSKCDDADTLRHLTKKLIETEKKRNGGSVDLWLD